MVQFFDGVQTKNPYTIKLVRFLKERPPEFKSFEVFPPIPKNERVEFPQQLLGSSPCLNLS